jgi:hypothetical protein
MSQYNSFIISFYFQSVLVHSANCFLQDKKYSIPHRNHPNSGDVALQVGRISNETVKYGRLFCGTWTRELTALARPRSNCTTKLQTHPLVREGSHIKKPAIVRQKT